jgi:hypothetical protein
MCSLARRPPGPRPRTRCARGSPSCSQARVWSWRPCRVVTTRPSGALAEIARRLAGCAGVVVLGLRHHGSDPDAAPLGTTPWTHVEAGMAYGRGLPLVLLREPGVDTGAFDEAVDGHRSHVVDLGDCWDEEAVRTAVAPWVFEVSG